MKPTTMFRCWDCNRLFALNNMYGVWDTEEDDLIDVCGHCKQIRGIEEVEE